MKVEIETRNDPSDGLPATPVGSWAVEKYELLAHYVRITREARRKFVGAGKAGATFIDLFCASGRSYLKGTDQFIDGSPLVAWKASQECGVPFSVIHLNDSNDNLLDAAEARLKLLGATVIKHGGLAEIAAADIVSQLDPYALHFALIDPFRLQLPFSMIKTLAKMKRMDLLVHVSAMDLHRNWKLYVQSIQSPLDIMAPGWRVAIDIAQPEEKARIAFIYYWIDQLKGLGYRDNLTFELITGPNHQPLYWLVLVAKHEVATTFWKKATQIGKTGDLF